jgi:O-methyltransferase
VDELLVESDPALVAALEHSPAAGLPPHDVSPSQAAPAPAGPDPRGAQDPGAWNPRRLQHDLARPRALPEDGRLVTLEVDPAYVEVARTNIEGAGLADVVELRAGPALDTLQQLAAEGAEPFDPVFMDADKRSNPDYLARVLELSRPGSLIVADNVVRGGATVDSGDPDPDVRGVRRFFELLAAEPRVSATAIQTVGSKGHDGVAIALVTGVR